MQYAVTAPSLHPDMRKRSKILFWSVLVTLLSVALLTDFARAEDQTERILEFFSEIVVEADGALLVTENITVRARGEKIRRGIVRELPTSGGRFQLLGVERNGKRESYQLQKSSDRVTIQIGNKDILLAAGDYVYQINYRLSGQLGFFEDHDELYWNVNGNDWRLPLDKVRCTVRLPGVSALEAVVYEGVAGSTASRSFPGGTESLSLASSRPYRPGEGLTVAVSWPKGFVTEDESATGFWMEAPGMPAKIAGGGLALLLAYYILAWFRVGRDPAKGVIIPRFKPPLGFSPAMTRTVFRQGFDNAAFAAGVVNMAVKGALRIEGKTLVLTEDASRLSADERAAWEELRKADGEIRMERSPVVRKGYEAMRKTVEKSFAKAHFRENVGWMVPGIAITVLSVAGASWWAPDPQLVFFLGIWLMFWTFACFRIFLQVVEAWKKSGVRGKASALGQTFFSLPFFAGAAAGLFFWAMQISPAGAAFLGLALGANALFFFLLPAPTQEGRRLLDEIEGFRMYLGTAEKHRLEFLHSPKETPQLFEEYLPYAMALDVENQWGERFAEILNQAGYEAQWLGGGGFHSGRTASLASALNRGVQGNRSSSRSGFSSGMGGGGSSGGGRGGGGGGGW